MEYYSQSILCTMAFVKVGRSIVSWRVTTLEKNEWVASCRLNGKNPLFIESSRGLLAGMRAPSSRVVSPSSSTIRRLAQRIRRFDVAASNPVVVKTLP